MTTTMQHDLPAVVGLSHAELVSLYAENWRTGTDTALLNWHIIGQIGQAGLQRVFAAAWVVVKEGTE